jgi:predicted transcriptional regulator of viral defense system
MPDGRALTRRQGRTAPTSRAASSSPADLVKAHFAASVGKKVSIDDLAAAIPGVDPKILRATVARLSRKNKREYRRSARGTYVYKPRPA